MTCTALTAGVDVGKTFLDLGFHPTGKPIRHRNHADGIAKVVTLVKKRGVPSVAIEAIGPYAQRLVVGLTAAGVAVSIVDPRRIRAFRTAEGRIAKIDPLDAVLIARFAHLMKEHLRAAPSADQIAFKALSTRRRQLIELIAMEKTRLAQAVEDETVDSHKSVIKALTAVCAEVEGELARRIAADQALARKHDILLSIPGIGARIAPLLTTDMPELRALDRKAVAGLAPHPQPERRRGGPQRHRGRPALHPLGLLHGRHGGGPLVAGLQGHLQGPARSRQAAKGGHRRHGAPRGAPGQCAVARTQAVC